MNRLFKISIALVMAVISRPIMAQDIQIPNIQIPELGDTVKVGQWYMVSDPDFMSADGSSWKGVIKTGSENKVVVIFYGGGVSLNEYTAARGSSVDKDHGFYSDNFAPNAEIAVPLVEAVSFGSPAEINPFKDWTLVVLPYTTGDFHCGTGDFPYKGLDGKDHILHHHGYTNYRIFMDRVRPILGTPDAVMVTGFSAGGFATAILSDDVFSYFPDTKNKISFVDSSLLAGTDWHSVAENVWKAPKQIVDRLVSDDIVFDCLTALAKDRPEVKILFGCTVRDYALSNYYSYIETGNNLVTTRENCDNFQKLITEFVSKFQKAIPNGGLYIWDGVWEDQSIAAMHHTIQLSKDFFTEFHGHASHAQWLIDAVNGNVKSYGIELVHNVYE